MSDATLGSAGLVRRPPQLQYPAVGAPVVVPDGPVVRLPTWIPIFPDFARGRRLPVACLPTDGPHPILPSSGDPDAPPPSAWMPTLGPPTRRPVTIPEGVLADVPRRSDLESHPWVHFPARLDRLPSLLPGQRRTAALVPVNPGDIPGVGLFLAWAPTYPSPIEMGYGHGTDKKGLPGKDHKPPKDPPPPPPPPVFPVATLGWRPRYPDHLPPRLGTIALRTTAAAPVAPIDAIVIPDLAWAAAYPDFARTRVFDPDHQQAYAANLDPIAEAALVPLAWHATYPDRVLGPPPTGFALPFVAQAPPSEQAIVLALAWTAKFPDRVLPRPDQAFAFLYVPAFPPDPPSSFGDEIGCILLTRLAGSTGRLVGVVVTQAHGVFTVTRPILCNSEVC